MSNYFEDLEDEWRKKKWGCFSASEIYKLLVPGAKGMFGEGAMTYIKRIAREAYTMYNEDDKGFTSNAMRNGTMKEPESFGHLYKLLGFEGLQYCGIGEPVFQYFDADSGCSPDVLAPKPDGIISFGAELKNPKGDTHFSYLIDEKDKINDQWDLKNKLIKFYSQCQFSMMSYKCDLWLWCSYNEYFPLKDRMLIIEVKKDDNFQNNLEARLVMAEKKKYEFLEQLKNR